GHDLFATPSLKHFLTTRITREAFERNPEHLLFFVQLDDVDILASIKVWENYPDRTLSLLCKGLMSRHLNQVNMSDDKPNQDLLMQLRKEAKDYFEIPEEEVGYFVYSKTISNSAYQVGDGSIKILMKNGVIKDITQASDLSNLEVLSKKVQKYIVSFPKDLRSKGLF